MTIPNIIIMSSGKGGIGKTTVCCALADILDIISKPYQLTQVDDQDRLPKLYPDKVTTIQIEKLNQTRRDPNAIIKIFDPLYALLEQSAGKDIITIIDVGATQQHALLQYAGLTDLDEDLTELQLNCLWLVPCTAEPESMRQAVTTFNSAGKTLPSINRMIVLNERDGKFEFYPNSPAELIWQKELRSLIADHGSITIEQIPAGSWLPFEAAGMRFLDVISASIPDIQKLIGVSRPEAKVIRGDVSAWMANTLDTVTELFNLNIEGDSE